MEYARGFERAIARIIGKLPDWVRPIMVGISAVGSPLVTTITFLIVMAVTYQQMSIRLFLIEVILLALIPLGGIIKLITRRPRPETIYVERMLFKTYSFPSGHAYGSFIVFGFLIALCIRYLTHPWDSLLSGILALLILLVGISRVYLGAHFPSDVLGAWFIGGFVISLFLIFW